MNEINNLMIYFINNLKCNFYIPSLISYSKNYFKDISIQLNLNIKNIMVLLYFNFIYIFLIF